MKQLDFDLGYKQSDRFPQDTLKSSLEETRFPEFTVDDDEKRLDIPKRGKMLIEFEEVSRSESSRGDSEHYVCTIAVKKILGVEGARDERPAKSDTSTSDALDAIAEALEKATS